MEEWILQEIQVDSNNKDKDKFKDKFNKDRINKRNNTNIIINNNNLKS